MSHERTWLKSLRNEKGFTMKKLADELELSESYVCLLESGARRPHVNTAKKIGEALGFDWKLFYEDGGKAST